MNDLSWLLYAADVLPSFKSFILRLAFLFSILGVGWAVLKIVSFVMMHDPASDDDDKAVASTLGDVSRPLGVSLVVYLVACIFVQLIPSKETIYLMAASEMGEEALKTEQAKKVGDYLDSLLDDLADRAQEEG